jgi:hypothetical protein
MSVKCTVCRSRSEKYHECIHCGNRYDDVEKLAAHQLERGHPGGHAPARGPLARVERRSYLEMLNDKSDDAAADTETYELHDDDDVVNTNDSVEDAVPQGRSTSRGRRGGKRFVADAEQACTQFDGSRNTAATTDAIPAVVYVNYTDCVYDGKVVDDAGEVSAGVKNREVRANVQTTLRSSTTTTALRLRSSARAGAAIRTARCCSAKERRLISPPTSTSAKVVPSRAMQHRRLTRT